jgi:hypothetical protein
MSGAIAAGAYFCDSDTGRKRLMLGPGVSFGMAIEALDRGETDTDSLYSWLCSTTVKLERADWVSLLGTLSGMQYVDVQEAQRGFMQKELQGKATGGRGGVGKKYVTISQKGFVILNGVNPSSYKGFEPMFHPVAFAAALDLLSEAAQAVIDASGDVVPADAKIKVSSGERQEKSNARGKTWSAAVLVDAPHPRAGKPRLNLEGCSDVEKAALFAKCRTFLSVMSAGVAAVGSAAVQAGLKAAAGK